jgi:periplasmic divalent cation tolerance protein
MELSTVYVTVADRDAARRIATALVGERLAACVNLFSPVESVYRWEGRLTFDDEVALVVKTATARVEEVVSRVRELHDAAVPCITSWPITAGNPDYLRWVAESCTTEA